MIGTVDRTYENSPEDSEVVVILENGHKERFWLIGLSDEEYIRRANLIYMQEFKTKERK